MKVFLERINQNYAVKAANEQGKSIIVDGEGSSLTPMQSLLSAVAACTVVDVVEILKKQKQELKHIRMEASGEREQVAQVKPFRSIHIHYILYGRIDTQKAEKAIDLAFNKYCSVSASLSKEIKKTFSFEIIDE